MAVAVPSARTGEKVWVNHDTDLMDVTVASADGSGVIHATAHHLFWDATQKAWVEADRLRLGDRLRSDDGAIVTVQNTATVPGAASMWDLTITDDHDFYINTASATALVHNCPPREGRMTTA